MALTWDMRDVVEDATNANGTTHYVVCMLTIHVGMPHITADNVEEFFRRVAIVEGNDVFGALRGNDKGDVRLTLDECRSFIGMRTNATPYTARKFAANVKRIKEGR